MSNKTDLLHAQAMALILDAMGNGQVRFLSWSGDDGEHSSGVVLLDRDRIASDHYIMMGTAPTLWRFRTTITVSVDAEPVT